ncbi:MAG: hypothetical protein AB7F96_03280 [Beijerinckiaceae bacterium]
MDRKTHAGGDREPLYLHPLIQAAAAIAIGAALLLTSTQIASAKSIKIENATDDTLRELTLLHKSGTTPRTFVLARNIPPGATVTAQKPKGVCLVDVSGVYDNNAKLDAEDLDICSETELRLVK